jgi:hypothetical protein
MENIYFSENSRAEDILERAQRIALPTGKESGPIKAWMEDKMGWEYPEFIGRCLHLDSKQ